MNIVYLAVTNDRYELPIAIFEDKKSLCQWALKTKSSMNSAISRNQVDHIFNCRYVSIKINENEKEM